MNLGQERDDSPVKSTLVALPEDPVPGIQCPLLASEGTKNTGDALIDMQAEHPYM